MSKSKKKNYNLEIDELNPPQLSRIHEEDNGFNEEEELIDDEINEEDVDNEALEGEESSDNEDVGIDDEVDEVDEDDVEPSETEEQINKIDDNCLYKYADEKNNMDDDDEYDPTFDDDNIEIKSNIVKPQERITKPFLTKYEKTRLLGDRTQQLTLGAKPMIKNTENLPASQIAIMELEQNLIPLIIERELPNGNKERWYLNELQH